MLKHADQQTIKNQNIFYFDGNVEMEHDTINMKSDHAVYYKALNYVKLRGNVIIKTPSSIIKSKYGTFYQRESKAVFIENTYFENNLTRTYSDTLIHYYKNDFSELYGDANVLSKSDSAITLGDRIYNYANKKINVYGNAIYEKKLDDVKIVADTIDFYKAKNLAIAKSKVKIFQTDVNTKSGKAHYLISDSLLKLYIDPVVYFKNNEIRGDSIVAHYNSERMEKIDVLGSALTINVVDSQSLQINRIEGRKIFLYFDDESQLDHIRSINNAISIYYLKTEDDEDNGINSVSGDSLHIDFKESSLHDIKAFGGVKGTYYPAGYKGAIKNEF